MRILVYLIAYHFRRVGIVQRWLWNAIDHTRNPEPLWDAQAQGLGWRGCGANELLMRIMS